MNRTALCFPFLLLCFVSTPALAWGQQGHRLVAEVAEAKLTPTAHAEVERLLKAEPSPHLADIANWADNLRENDPDLGQRTARWHYVNIAEHHCHYETHRDCHDGNCVVEAIRRQTALLADRSQSDATRLQALKFVVHFVGDVHQPLHAGFAADKGGNTVQVNLDGKGSNLHSLWDSGMIKRVALEDPAWLQRLQQRPAPALGPRGEPARWAEASCKLVEQPGFYPAKAVIGTSYLQQWQPTVEQQLQMAGLRLADVLNGALGH